MKEVAMELELVQMLQKAPKLRQNYEELEYVQAEMHGSWDVVASSTISTSSVDVQPLLLLGINLTQPDPKKSQIRSKQIRRYQIRSLRRYPIRSLVKD
jgi:hypothetical protein